MQEKDIIYSVLHFDEDEPPQLFKFQIDKLEEHHAICSLPEDGEFKVYLLIDFLATTPALAWENYKKMLVEQIAELEEQIADVDLEILNCEGVDENYS
jgi:hypothetical protein